MNDLVTAVAAYKAIDHCITSADARLSYRASSEQLEYLRERDRAIAAVNERDYAARMDAAREDRAYRDKQLKFAEDQAEEDREHQAEMQKRELRMRARELRGQQEMHHEAVEASKYIAELNSAVVMRNSDLDREAMINMHARQLDQNEQLEMRRLRVQQNLADQNERLQLYLQERGIKSAQEIERFKALAMRETQILLARENAQNTLQDHMVQEALKTFPLNISPIVLLKNRPHSLTGLLRYSSQLTAESGLPSISQVYNDVKAYSENPEALNVFIAPIYIDSKIQNRENLSQQIWDSIYQQVESFFTEHYNRRGSHPVILYPTAWKDKSVAGQHASETLHFFLKDMPCLVLEPRFDGHSFSIMLSTWGLGYTSNDHIRTEINFEVNLDGMLIKSAYERSKKSLALLDQLGDKVSDLLSEKRKKLERNVEYYEMLKIDELISNKEMDEVSAIGVYNLFDIDPVQDMTSATDMMSRLLCINLAILADIHHLQSTDVLPVFPQLFKDKFSSLYENVELRSLVAKCYERIYIFLRNEDTFSVGDLHKREMERVREMQITNLNKQLELIDSTEFNDSMEDKIRKYAAEQLGITGCEGDELWNQVISKMTVNDIPFFKEILPNIDERRRYKQIDKRITELSR